MELAPAEDLGVELDGLIEVGDGEADVVNADEKIIVFHVSQLCICPNRMSIGGQENLVLGAPRRWNGNKLAD